MKIKRTRWPLFEFFITIWKLSITTALLRESPESLTYEYIILLIRWGSKEKYRFRLYDTYLRLSD